MKVNPLLVLLAVLFGTSMGDWVGGVFGGFVAAGNWSGYAAKPASR